MRKLEEEKIEQVHEKMTEYYQAWETLNILDELDQDINATREYREKIDAVSSVVSALLDLTAMESEMTGEELEEEEDGEDAETQQFATMTKKSTDNVDKNSHVPINSRSGRPFQSQTLPQDA